VLSFGLGTWLGTSCTPPAHRAGLLIAAYEPFAALDRRMNEGRVVQAGAPRQIYDEPANPFVAGFVWGAEPLVGVVRGGRVRAEMLDVPAPSNVTEGSSALIAYRAGDVRVLPIERRAEGMAHGVVERLRPTSRPPKALVRLNGHTLAVDITPEELSSGFLEPGKQVAVDVRKFRVFPGRTAQDVP
jgi:ABC-type sulfate/molybdate transport systems ATPase subunit